MAMRSPSVRRIALLTGALIAIVRPSLAAEFVVVPLTDAVDAAPGDGLCASALAAAPCTLRAAVQEANALPGADESAQPSLPRRFRIRIDRSVGNDRTVTPSELQRFAERRKSSRTASPRC
ncbi:MAG: hypothetical protein ABI639_05685 [Thermoanaerobaculia bacterium]